MSISTCQVRHYTGMSLRHALLGLLTWKPGTGYELAQCLRGLADQRLAREPQPDLSRAGQARGRGPGRDRRRGPAPLEDLRGHRRRPRGAAPLADGDRAQPRPAQRDRAALVPRLHASSPSSGAWCSSASWRSSRPRPSSAARWRRSWTPRARRGGFRPLLDLGARMDAVMIGWLREQIEATRRT